MRHSPVCYQFACHTVTGSDRSGTVLACPLHRASVCGWRWKTTRSVIGGLYLAAPINFNTLIFNWRWPTWTYEWRLGLCYLYDEVSNVITGGYTVQAVIRRPVTSEARVQPQISLVGFMVEKVASGQAFHWALLFSPCQYHYTSAPYSIIYL